MMRLFTIITILILTLAVTGCSEQDDSSVEKLIEEKPQEEKGSMSEEQEGPSEKDSFAAIQKVSDVYMLSGQYQVPKQLKLETKVYVQLCVMHIPNT